MVAEASGVRSVVPFCFFALLDPLSKVVTMCVLGVLGDDRLDGLAEEAGTGVGVEPESVGGADVFPSGFLVDVDAFLPMVAVVGDLFGLLTLAVEGDELSSLLVGVVRLGRRLDFGVGFPVDLGIDFGVAFEVEFDVGFGVELVVGEGVAVLFVCSFGADVEVSVCGGVEGEGEGADVEALVAATKAARLAVRGAGLCLRAEAGLFR